MEIERLRRELSQATQRADLAEQAQQSSQERAQSLQMQAEAREEELAELRKRTEGQEAELERLRVTVRESSQAHAEALKGVRKELADAKVCGRPADRCVSHAAPSDLLAAA